MQRPPLAATVFGLLLLPVTSACGTGAAVCDAGNLGPPPPTAAGAFNGTYDCNNNVRKLSAALAVTDDGQLDGEMFLDYQITILGQPITLTGRANVDDGRAEDDGHRAFVDVLDNSQGLADFHVRLTLSEDGRELDGELFHINADGEQTLTCPVELERNEVTDPVYSPDGPEADAG